MKSAESIRVDGPDQVGQARRSILGLAAEIGFGQEDSGRAAIIAAECAGNLWKHAGGGEILIQGTGPDEEPAIEILALDKGRGMANPEVCFQDGFSTAGSPGTGMGAIRRMASECHVHSVPGKGTALLARIVPRRRTPPSAVPLEIGGLSVPKPGEDLCGDAWAAHQSPGLLNLMVVDGLGHGPMAAACAAMAVSAFREHREAGPADMLTVMHGALRSTRGAALAAARFDTGRREVRFCGIGNIAAVVVAGGNARHMVSQPGIVGNDVRHVREFTYPWPSDALALLYSDGIGSHWSLTGYDALSGRDTTLIAGVVYRDWNRGRDDATIVVAREKGPT